MTCPEPFSIGGVSWHTGHSGAAQDRLAHPIRIRRSQHLSALAIKTITLDAAKIEHGRREDPFVQFRPQGREQSSPHPDTCCRDAANIEKSVVVLKEKTRGGTSVGTSVARQAVPEGVPGTTTYRDPSHQPYYGISGSLSSPRGSP